MPWTDKVRKPRPKLEEETSAVPLVKDTWVKAKLLLTHVAGLSSLVSTMNVESAQQRYAIDRLTEQFAAFRAEENERWNQLAEWTRS